MTDLEQLRRDLTHLADQDRPRGAGAVLIAARADGARRQRRRTRSVRLAAAAAALALIAALAWWPRGRTVTGEQSTEALASIEVHGSNASVLGLAFGRIWVRTDDLDRRAGQPPRTSQLQVFDSHSGRRVRQIAVNGPIAGFAASDRFGFLAINPVMSCPAGPECSQVVASHVLRIDPRSLQIVPVRGTEDALRVVGSPDRIAVVRQHGLTLLDRDGSVVAEGPPGATSHLAFSRDGSLVFARLDGYLVRIDSTTGQVEQEVDLGAYDVVNASVGPERVWLTTANLRGDLVSIDLPNLHGATPVVKPSPSDGEIVVTSLPGGDVLVHAGRYWVVTTSGRTAPVDLAGSSPVARGCSGPIQDETSAWIEVRSSCTSDQVKIRFVPIPTS